MRLTSFSFRQVADDCGIQESELHSLVRAGVIRDHHYSDVTRMHRMSAIDRLRVLAHLGDEQAAESVREIESRLSKREDVG